MTDSATDELEKPAVWPTRIALALSGGGYRAAAFHLGALRALHDLGLLNRQTIVHLSTASGGTMLGALWLQAEAQAKAAGKPLDFSAFEQSTVDLMVNTHIGVEAYRKREGAHQDPEAKVHEQERRRVPSRAGETVHAQLLTKERLPLDDHA